LCPAQTGFIEAGFFMGVRTMSGPFMHRANRGPAMTTKEPALQVIENLRGTPFVMALLVINIIGLAGFAFTLRDVGNAIERRDAILKACIDQPR
jgi:hypothetical protein